MKSAHIVMILILSSLQLAGCVSGSGEGGNAPSAGRGVADVNYGALINGPAGRQLGEADRQRAHEAQISAATSGQRTSWRGDKGAYGYIEPTAATEGLGGNCRDYVHTIYIDGRPQRGNGQACRGSDGLWQVAN